MAPPRRTVAVDLDGCLYDFIGAMNQRLKDRWGILKTTKDWTTPDLGALLCSFTEDEEIRQDLLDRLYDPGFYSGIKPYPNAFNAVARLARFGRVVAISARPYHTRAISNIAIRRDFGDLIEQAYLSEKKWRTAHREGVTWAVDDSLTHAQTYASHHVTCFLIRNPEMPYTMTPYRKTRWIKEIRAISEMPAYLESFYGQACVGGY